MVLEALPAATHLIADRGYDSAWFQKALLDKGIEPCIPSSRSLLEIHNLTMSI
jgi:hypothetical protein